VVEVVATKRVFIVWTHLLFRDSVRLLLNDPAIVWLGETSDYNQATREVSKLCPDTIIVEEINDMMSGRILEILKASPESGRVLGLNLNDNKLSVYAHQTETVGQANDLLNVVLREPVKGENG